MSAWVRVALMVSLVGPVLGCVEERWESPLEPLPSESTVSGSVVSEASGMPMVDANVSIGVRRTTTASNGRFELTGLVPGAAKLRAVALGFEQLEMDIIVSPGSMEVGVVLRAPSPEWGPPVDSVTYDLSAPVEGFDRAWGDQTGARYTAVVRLPADFDSRLTFGGTFSEWRYASQDQHLDLGTGRLSGRRGFDGDLIIQVWNSGSQSPFWFMQGYIQELGQLMGTWGCCGHLAGTFEAVRRQVP